KFCRAFHVFFLAHSRARVFVSAFEDVEDFWIFGRAADEREHWLSKFSCQPRHANRRFPFQRLPIQTPLTGNHHVYVFHLQLKPDCFCDTLESRPDCRVAKTQQSEAETACGARTHFVPIVETEFCGHDVREPRQRAFSIVQVTFT